MTRPYHNNGVLIGTGAAAPPRSVPALTNGQMLIGSTGYPPVPATITGSGGLTVTGGAGTLAIGMMTAVNYVFNSDMEIWGAGVSAAPTGWSLGGAGASVARNTTAGQFKTGTASAAVTRAGADAFLSQGALTSYPSIAWWKGQTVILGAWVRATVASRAAIGLNDGATTVAQSAYHSGGGALEFLTTATWTIGDTATNVVPFGMILTGDTTAQFDSFVLVVGSSVSNWFPSEWSSRLAALSFAGTVAGPVAGVTAYLGTLTSVTEAEVQTVCTRPCVLRRLRNRAAAVPGGVETFAYTLRKNGGDTALTATTTSAATASSDLVNEVACAAGDLLSVKIINSALGATTVHHSAVEVEWIPG